MHNFFFDFDSTLADTRNVAVIATQRAFAARGLTQPSRATVVSYMGVPIEVSFAKMADRALTAVELETLYTTFREQYQQAEQLGISLFTGMADTLSELKARGERLYVVSSKHSVPLQRNLEQVGLGTTFAAISGSDTVANYKPAPDGILNLLDRFDLMAAESVMIGDAKYDMQMGHNAGVATAAALWGAADPESVKAEEPTYLLQAPMELLTI
ncbi:HAD family hydrolase [Levilactobacillus tongjiangensis]|uniref:HAD family hydrolase n=1 Tax=Levilactobacillus tongjiangensis TaxID=2486023 RepID=A0ABW1STK7_9LACO|nr:HAD family hydrolase [Levilactobacillus tongjiangensis]